MKGAVKAARAYIEEFFVGAKEILLEEVEMRPGYYESIRPETAPDRIYKKDPLWRVVLSFKLGEPGTLSEVMGGDPRLFREILVEPETGATRSIRTWRQ